MVELDFCLQSRITISLDQIPFNEYILLRIMADEREKYHDEERKKMKRT